MRKNVSKGEIGRMWVEQSQPEAKCSAMSFTGKTFYSYGTPIGKMVANSRGEKAFLVYTVQYSSTSSMHRGVMRSAIPAGSIVFEVPTKTRIDDYSATVLSLRSLADKTEEESRGVREPKQTRLLKEAQDLREQADRMATFFGL